jgi:hypothetical protein
MRIRVTWGDSDSEESEVNDFSYPREFLKVVLAWVLAIAVFGVFLFMAVSLYGAAEERSLTVEEVETVPVCVDVLEFTREFNNREYGENAMFDWPLDVFKQYIAMTGDCPEWWPEEDRLQVVGE